ncbi:uncharacterized protein LOC110461143 [Mizuhopecten yessoensis]|uniref:uncharacterized protein LOC110461143 n=1 Tax=Mizuhopecten yessoensis TaxID=6573 RepID=UPI000B45CF3A|nr:uncharacterized protein LOC110461143 [Mizuhopecten yessoensis]
MSLTIPAAYVTEDEHGTDWTCEIFLGAVSNIVQLTLIVPVTTATMTTAGMYQPSVMITAGYNRTFLCTTSAGRPVAKIAWFREEKNITDHAGTAIDRDAGDEKYSRQQSLTITGSVGDTDSRLKCEAVNIEGRIPVSSQTSNIIIQWAPQTDPSLTIDPANKKLTDGVSVTMTCRQVGGKPLATLTWSGVCSFWNTPIDSRDNTTVTSSIHFSMNKTYTGLACICVSRQQVNSYQKSVNQTFDVLYPPDQMSITYSNYSFVDDTASRQLRCAPDGNPQSFTFSKWQHMSEYSQLIRELDGVTSGNESVLTIPDPGLDARYQDTGYYVCKVQNGVPGRNNQMVFDKRVFLSVNAPPVFDHSNWIFPGQMEKSITISVLFYSTSGYSKVELFSNQTVVGNRFVINTVTSNVSLTFHDTDITVGGFTATVSVQTLQHEDFTNYTLRVTNDAGIQNFGFYLSDKGPPSPPTHVFADCKGFGSAEVSWRAGNNGGYKQTFQVLYKTDGSVKAYRDIIIENGTDDYVMTLDNLEENSLHIFTILALNSFGNVTSTEIGKCTVHEKLSPTENTAMFNAGVAMLCIGIIAVISTMAIIIVFIKRKITCLSRGKETEQPIHLGNMNDAGPLTPGEDRTLYEKIDSDGRVQPSEYESIGKPSNSDASTTDRQQDSRAYESLHGRSQPNTYEDLGSTDNEQRGDRDYINRTNNDYINA